MLYRIPRSCRQCYIGQTECTITVRYKEYQHYLQLEQEDKSPRTEHGWKTGHKIMLSNMERLLKSSMWGERVIWESLEILLEAGASNCEDGM